VWAAATLAVSSVTPAFRMSPARRRREGHGIADGLGKHHDHLHMLVVDQEIHAGADVEHRFVAGGDAHRQADIAVMRHLHDLDGGGAALRHQRHLAWQEGRMERHRRHRRANREIGKAEAVRSEEGNTCFARAPGEFILQFRAFRARFREARGQDDGRLDAAGDGVFESVERSVERNKQVGGIDRFRNLLA